MLMFLLVDAGPRNSARFLLYLFMTILGLSSTPGPESSVSVLGIVSSADYSGLLDILRFPYSHFQVCSTRSLETEN
ncbi:hypothetical protein F5B18DRAFT_76 [Nemania serpens]|nr:hypothetical protein F5B18DRAFT_76 [Nemania serpens]